jgi:hypothetical protein
VDASTFYWGNESVYGDYHEAVFITDGVSG